MFVFEDSKTSLSHELIVKWPGSMINHQFEEKKGEFTHEWVSWPEEIFATDNWTSVKNSHQSFNEIFKIKSRLLL